MVSKSSQFSSGGGSSSRFGSNPQPAGTGGGQLKRGPQLKSGQQLNNPTRIGNGSTKVKTTDKNYSLPGYELKGSKKKGDIYNLYFEPIAAGAPQRVEQKVAARAPDIFSADAATFYGRVIPISAGRRMIAGVPIYANTKTERFLRVPKQGKVLSEPAASPPATILPGNIPSITTYWYEFVAKVAIALGMPATPLTAAAARAAGWSGFAGRFFTVGVYNTNPPNYSVWPYHETFLIDPSVIAQAKATNTYHYNILQQRINNTWFSRIEEAIRRAGSHNIDVIKSKFKFYISSPKHPYRWEWLDGPPASTSGSSGSGSGSDSGGGVTTKKSVFLAYAFGQPGVPPEELDGVEVSRVWANEKLIYDKSSISGWNIDRNVKMTVYDGDPDQLPDPELLRDFGVGNAPAFRGLIYVMFENLLGSLVNVPNVRAELVDVIDPIIDIYEPVRLAGRVGERSCFALNRKLNHIYTFSGSTNTGRILTTDLTNEQELSDVPLTNLLGVQVSRPTDTVICDPFYGYIISQVSSGSNFRPSIVFDPSSGQELSKTGVESSGELAGNTALLRKYCAVSINGGAMDDTLLVGCHHPTVTLFFGDPVYIFRLTASGVITIPWKDAGSGTIFPDGTPMVDVTTGDPINRLLGYGTFYAASTTSIRRVTVPRGLGLDDPDADLDTDTSVITYPRFIDGVPDAIAGTTEVFLNDNDVSTPCSIPGTAIGNLTAAGLNARVVATIDYGESRDLHKARIRMRCLSLPSLEDGYQLVRSTDGVSWTAFGTTFSVGPLYSFFEYEVSISVAARYIGVALKARDFSAITDVEITTLDGYGFGGITEIPDPNITEPASMLLWTVPVGYTIYKMISDPSTSDIVVFYSNGTDHRFTRLELSDEVKGVPNPIPQGPSVSVLVDVPLGFSVTAFNGPDYDMLHYQDVSLNTLAIINTSLVRLVNLRSGFVKSITLPNSAQVTTPPSPTPVVVNTTIDLSATSYFNSASGYIFGRNNVGTTNYGWSKIYPKANTKSEFNLADIIRWIAIRGGYSSSQISFTGYEELEATGSIVTSRVNLMDVLKDMSFIYNFDIFESENKIKFVKRSKGSSLSIDVVLEEDDLAPLDSGESPSFITRDVSAEEMPRSIEMQYIDESSDYTVSLVRASRPTHPVDVAAGSSGTESYAIPIVMPPQDALKLVSSALYGIWTSKLEHQFRVLPENLRIEPSDVTTLSIGGYDYTMKVQEATINADNSQSILAKNFATGDDVEYEEADNTFVRLPQGIAGPSLTNFYFLDVPTLYDDDIVLAGSVEDEVPTYMAATSYGQPNWEGAEVQYLNGRDWTTVLTETETTFVTGSVITPLPSFPGNTIDEIHTMRVNITSFGFPNMTSDIDPGDPAQTEALMDVFLNDDANMCVIGAPSRWEVIQYRDIQFIAGNQYDISFIARGRRGTEQNTSRHRAGDKFILISRPPVRLSSMPLDKVGTTVRVRALGTGMDPVAAQAVSVAYEGAFEKAFAPTGHNAIIDGGDLVLSWIRRTRYRTTVEDLSDTTPLEGGYQEYELEIIDDGEVLRTVTGLLVPTYRYLQANILTDLGATASLTQITFRVYQLDQKIGRGFAGEATLDLV